MIDETDDVLNLLHRPLQPGGLEPRTGFRRDGACNTGPRDFGRHLLCAGVTRESLEFSRAQGNDLITAVSWSDRHARQ